ncbi:MAG: hypothetical protein MHPSP_003808, partial [Paramarteilia canceri]
MVSSILYYDDEEDDDHRIRLSVVNIIIIVIFSILFSVPLLFFGTCGCFCVFCCGCCCGKCGKGPESVQSMFSKKTVGNKKQKTENTDPQVLIGLAYEALNRANSLIKLQNMKDKTISYLIESKTCFKTANDKLSEQNMKLFSPEFEYKVQMNNQLISKNIKEISNIERMIHELMDVHPSP